MSSRLKSFRDSRWPALIAAGCAALVLILVVLAASPEAHHWLHSDSDQADHDCAVVLFAHGLAATLAEIVLTLVAWRLLSLIGQAGASLRLSVPPHFLPPACAPPAR